MNTIENVLGQAVTIKMTERVTVEVVPTENGTHKFDEVLKSFTEKESEFVFNQMKDIVKTIENETYTKEYFEEVVTVVEYVKEDDEYVTYKVETVDLLNESKGLYEVIASKKDEDVTVKDLVNGHTW